jgi:hypothetical protein
MLMRGGATVSYDNLLTNSHHSRTAGGIANRRPRPKLRRRTLASPAGWPLQEGKRRRSESTRFVHKSLTEAEIPQSLRSARLCTARSGMGTPREGPPA